LATAIAAMPGGAMGQQRRDTSPMPPAPSAPLDDPIGLLLEHRTDIQLADSQVTALVRLNLRLFRRNRQLRLRLDSIMPPDREPETNFGRGMPARSADSLDPMAQRARQLLEQIRENARAARDSAFALLTPEQQDRARRLEERERPRGPRPGGRPGGGRPER
jgi:hypothetical protein